MASRAKVNYFLEIQFKTKKQKRKPQITSATFLQGVLLQSLIASTQKAI